MFFTQMVDRLEEMGYTPTGISQILDPVALSLWHESAQAEDDDGEPGFSMLDIFDGSFFCAFCREHGAPFPHPEHEGRSLFADAWSFDARDGGRAWPPPADPAERRRLAVLYWETRQAVVGREVEFLKGLLLDPRADAVPGLFAPYRAQLRKLEADMERTAEELAALEE